MDGTKLYRFTLRFGEARDTDDADGKVTATTDVRPTDDQITPPCRVPRRHHADPARLLRRQVAGERAYDMAREGRAPVLEPRPARVDSFELIDRPDPDHAVFEVASGKGVYMRSLARDLASACGTRLHRRTAPAACRPVHRGPGNPPGQTPANRRYPPASPDLLLPVATALADIPALALTESEAGGLGTARRSASSR